MKKILGYFIKIYQKIVSPTLPRTCRFYPSCSQYALEALDRHGFSAIFIIIKRIMRCNPFFDGGYDPIPEKGLTPIRGYNANT